MKTSVETPLPAVAMEGKGSQPTGAALDRGRSQRAGNGLKVSHFECQAPPGPTTRSEASWKKKWTAAQSHGLQDKCRGTGAKRLWVQHHVFTPSYDLDFHAICWWVSLSFIRSKAGEALWQLILEQANKCLERCWANCCQLFGAGLGSIGQCRLACCENPQGTVKKKMRNTSLNLSFKIKRKVWLF